MVLVKRVNFQRAIVTSHDNVRHPIFGKVQRCVYGGDPTPPLSHSPTPPDALRVQLQQAHCPSLCAIDHLGLPCDDRNVGTCPGVYHRTDGAIYGRLEVYLGSLHDPEAPVFAAKHRIAVLFCRYPRDHNRCRDRGRRDVRLAVLVVHKEIASGASCSPNFGALDVEVSDVLR